MKFTKEMENIVLDLIVEADLHPMEPKRPMIRKMLPKIIESVAEEIINTELWTGDGKGDGEEIVEDTVQIAFLRQEQRLKVKEILSNLK